MITQNVIDALQAALQTAYTNAGSAVVVLAEWPDPTQDAATSVLILHEGNEVDVLLGNGMRGNPSLPSMPNERDIVYATYRQPSVTLQGGGVTMPQAQATMRADKAVLLGVFVRTSTNLTLNGAVIDAGTRIAITHPPTGPYDQVDTQGQVRFVWRAAISIRASNHV